MLYAPQLRRVFEKGRVGSYALLLTYSMSVNEMGLTAVHLWHIL